MNHWEEFRMNYHFLRTLIATFVLAMALIGCASNKAISTDESIGLKAENTPEGIVFTFDHIPSETTRMFIHLTEAVEGANVIPVFTDIRGTLLDQVKEKGKVVCPFVRNGHHYLIAVSIDTGNNENWVDAEITAGNGIYTLNEIDLELNEAQTGVTLSAEPVFSADVQYASPKFEYVVTVKVDNGSIGYGEQLEDELAWEFIPGIVEGFKRDNIQVNGNSPAYVTAYCKINYGDLLWTVGIVNSKEFLVSL
ncbi:MAG: hypothetical protein LBB48_01395 [Treponema sp.]|jgi:hypothetical protein|nr:hypothetical protein [Treponema sp.]